MKTLTLTSEHREFLSKVAQAIFSNPFSEERARIDLELSGLPESSSRPQRLEAMLVRVSVFLEKLDSDGRTTLSLYSGEDRRLMELAWLFDAFHRLTADLDRLIELQIAADQTSCPVPFAADAIASLAKRGFPRADALKYFAMFYQLRRAFFFIDRSLIGQSPCMQKLRLALWNNVFTRDIGLYERHLWNRMEDFSTLLIGETGSGKGAAASAIGRSGFIPFDEKRHCFSESFMRSFTAVNLSQFTESLIESELFGHRKGAFTGATEAHDGVFARCSAHGAIFLDEIGEVSAPTQIKLLQVLQERTFSPVGSHEKKRFSGRVIAATNRTLDDLRRSRLRDDFFYRLSSDVIIVPPLRRRLRENPGELVELVSVTLRRILGEDSPESASRICRTLAGAPGRDYPWPGNVRELEQAARRILLTHEYASDSRAAAPDLAARLRAGIEAGTHTADELLAGYCRLLYERHGTYEAVAARAALDRRTARKYVAKS